MSPIGTPVARLAVLVVVAVVVLAGMGGTTTALFGDSETLEANFTSGYDVAERTAGGDPGGAFEVLTHNGRDQDDWAESIDYGPQRYNTSILVIVDPDDEVKLEITSDADERLVFEIEERQLLNALDATDPSQLRATLDGVDLDIETRNGLVRFEISEFSTRYVIFTAVPLPPSDDGNESNGNGNGNGAGNGQQLTSSQSPESESEQTESESETEPEGEQPEPEPESEPSEPEQSEPESESESESQSPEGSTATQDQPSGTSP